MALERCETNEASSMIKAFQGMGNVERPRRLKFTNQSVREDR